MLKFEKQLCFTYFVCSLKGKKKSEMAVLMYNFENDKILVYRMKAVI